MFFGDETVALQVFTGNRVSDGIVVFMTGDGNWTERVALSGVLSSKAEVERMTEVADAAAADAVVVDPYLIEVTLEDGDIRPVRYRERIRAYGPSIHPDFAKVQATSDPDHFSPGGKASRPSADGA